MTPRQSALNPTGDSVVGQVPGLHPDTRPASQGLVWTPDGFQPQTPQPALGNDGLIPTSCRYCWAEMQYRKKDVDVRCPRCNRFQSPTSQRQMRCPKCTVLIQHPPRCLSVRCPYCRTELSWTTMRQQAYYLACQRATQQYGHVNRQKKRSVMRRPTPNETAPHPPHHNT
ncbi:unnamed protein product (mitochondrion) [Plasmodiophora brassicae]|uniref:Uncharacterized protein n=1 Tax=Plasmodiophora brassicae TaxID=37360 RepID=A0A0G4II71_PLABS|nr:hypothetical protein PBRA_003716 [Plasmodiophora brassicae]SPQ94237.1 unnamed protein product [Plasmodiophora brassicae]